MKKEIWKNIKRWWTETDEEKEERKENQDYDKFIKKVEKRMDKISLAKKANTREGMAQIALMFENAYTQKKITESNKTIGRATIVLAIATTALVIATAYGATGLENAFSEFLEGLIGVIVIIAILWIIGALTWMIKLFYRIFRGGNQ